MRDPARIDRILESLGKFWKAHPDMRLGQIVSFALGKNVELVDDWVLRRWLEANTPDEADKSD